MVWLRLACCLVMGDRGGGTGFALVVGWELGCSFGLDVLVLYAFLSLGGEGLRIGMI